MTEHNRNVNEMLNLIREKADEVMDCRVSERDRLKGLQQEIRTLEDLIRKQLEPEETRMNSFVLSEINYLDLKVRSLITSSVDVNRRIETLKDKKLFTNDNEYVTIEDIRSHLRKDNKVARNIRELKKKYGYGSRVVTLYGIGIDPTTEQVKFFKMLQYDNMKRYLNTSATKKLTDKINMNTVIKMYLIPDSSRVKPIIEGNLGQFLTGRFDDPKNRDIEQLTCVFRTPNPEMRDHVEGVYTLEQV